MGVLVAGDNVKMALPLKRGLEEEGHAVDVVSESAEWIGRENPYDAVILDVMLPELSRLRGPPDVEPGWAVVAYPPAYRS
jgi:DNA-binding response OmpR family regulator